MLAAGVAVEEVRVRAVPAPAVLVTVAVTVEAVSNTNPDGAFNTIVPVPISLPVLSSSSGPVKVVHAAPVLSAEQAVLSVLLMCACTQTPDSHPGVLQAPGIAVTGAPVLSAEHAVLSVLLMCAWTH